MEEGKIKKPRFFGKKAPEFCILLWSRSAVLIGISAYSFQIYHILHPGVRAIENSGSILFWCANFMIAILIHQIKFL